MKKIDTEKLSKEMNDTLMHRACVMRSGMYLARYLIHKNRSVDAIRLIGRCQIHDISKIQNTEEFMSLASIVDDIEQMSDIEHVPTPEQVEAKKLHWKNNSHHPEYYESSNDMSELDLLEMACDCHARSRQYGTDLLKYIDTQQKIRFHFDQDHFRKLKVYCAALVELTKNDNYATVLNDDSKVGFELRDSTMKMLEVFDEDCYIDFIKTDRLYLHRESTPDFASVGYSIYLKDNGTEIGYISLKFNGYLEYKIYEKYLGNGYTYEAFSKFIETSSMDELFIIIKRENDFALEAVEQLGFKPIEYSENAITYKYQRPVRNLVKSVRTLVKV